MDNKRIEQKEQLIQRIKELYRSNNIYVADDLVFNGRVRGLIDKNEMPQPLPKNEIEVDIGKIGINYYNSLDVESRNNIFTKDILNRLCNIIHLDQYLCNIKSGSTLFTLETYKYETRNYISIKLGFEDDGLAYYPAIIYIINEGKSYSIKAEGFISCTESKMCRDWLNEYLSSTLNNGRLAKGIPARVNHEEGLIDTVLNTYLNSANGSGNSLVQTLSNFTKCDVCIKSTIACLLLFVSDYTLNKVNEDLITEA